LKLDSENINALLDACKRGKHTAQNTLYNHYARQMFTVALRIVKQHALAEDCMQDAFIKAFAQLGQFEYRSSFGAWLKRIVVNTAIDAIRKQKLEIEFDTDLHETESPTEIETQDTTEEICFNVERIKSAMLLLPDGYRIVLSLILFEGYDHDEVAAILAVSSSTSRSQYTRARHRLLEILSK
jgi:RNA polymerase sigma-70 factor (ECF subfamily)